MKLSDVGESRVRGYLFVLGRSLRASLPSESASDSLREVESHLRERIAEAPGATDERATLEAILARIGDPLAVAQAYSTEMAVEDAVVSGRVSSTLRALWRLATTGLAAFSAAFGLFVGYVLSLAFFAIAVLKPIFPDNVGFFFRNGLPQGLGAQFPVPPGTVARGGYALVPICIALGLLTLGLTQRAARAFLRRWRRHHGEGAGRLTE